MGGGLHCDHDMRHGNQPPAQLAAMRPRRAPCSTVPVYDALSVESVARGAGGTAVDVEDEHGQLQAWALEGASPTSIQELGVSKDHLLPGDRISARCHRLKDGSPGCVLGFVTPMHGDLARGHGAERAWN